MISSTTSATSTPASAASGGSGLAASGTDIQDRFLKLLVAQLNNQDPMNPMDNAQMTTQMAQINTVTGIQQVNDTLKSMADQFASLQVMQGLSMVGRDVLVQGNALVKDGAGMAGAAIDLKGKADAVKVEILSPSGQLIDAVNLGALNEGRHTFSWDASNYQWADPPRFRVAATQGKLAVETATLSFDKVVSVGKDSGAMSMQMRSGKTLAYTDIKAIY